MKKPYKAPNGCKNRTLLRLERAEAVCESLRRYITHARNPIDPVLDALRHWMRPIRRKQ